MYLINIKFKNIIQNYYLEIYFNHSTYKYKYCQKIHSKVPDVN